VKATELAFVTVIVWRGLVVFTGVEGNESDAGETAIAATPIPLRETSCGLPIALSVIFSEPVREPFQCGVKVTVTVQLAPPAS
jgi:hypothetical protein